MDGLFGINGLLGYAVAVVLLLSILAIFGFNGVMTQKANATNYYMIEKPFDLGKIDTNNVKHVKDK